MRSHACDIFDLLKKSYEGRVNFITGAEQIAREATQIVLAVWDQAGAITKAETWRDSVTRAIVQYVGWPLTLGQPLEEAAVDPVTESPLLIMLKAARSAQQPVSALVPPAPQTEESPSLAETASLVERRERMLNTYKAKNAVSNRRIYEAANSGIHKPQFYEWVNGTLPMGSATTKNFERFLQEQKAPIPRKPKV